ncbi:MAG TPA: crossover junction endodeoxyribonuclease RuvC [Flavitalea sp.]|nr:crossover junction endodeoxyribonuclease RuvC [Flavitalea sp.]
MQKSSTIILGIDPGTLVMGYAIIMATDNKIRMITMDVLKLSGKKNNFQRLELIHKKVNEIIRQFKPDLFAIEAPFFGKNVQSMLKLGRAQGVAIAAAIGAGLDVCEYSPKKIKQAVTGNGNADKEQVWKMLQHILEIRDARLSLFDASDALAVAVCHHFQRRNPVPDLSIKTGGWKDFVAKNPGRLKSK